MPETRKRPAPFQLRGLSPETVAEIQHQASIRGWTLAWYIKRLIELHKDLTTLTKGLQEGETIRVDKVLAFHGLQPVKGE